MNSEYWNSTVSLSHISMIMPLISLMATRFYISTFTLISDVETEWVKSDVESLKTFVKIASKFCLRIQYNIEEDNYVDEEKENMGYILIGKPDFRYSQVINRQPKLAIAIYSVERNDPAIPKVLSKLVIPPSTSAFIIPIITNSEYFPQKTIVKCLRLYRPISDLPLKVFPTMQYEDPGNPQWNWVNKKMNWNSFEKETRNLSGINITIAFVLNMEEKEALKIFWEGANSYFWNATKEHLQFQPVILYERTVHDAKSMADVYVRLMFSGADGLGVLPIPTPERSFVLDFIYTGVDAKFRLLVKKPEYVYSWQSILKNLDFECWIGLTMAILLISITLRITTSQEESPLADFSSCLFTVFGFVCSQGCPHMPRNLSSLMVCYTALLFSILISEFYTSNFYSILSTKEARLPFNSLEEFIAKGTHALYVNPDSEIYEYLVNAEKGTFKKLWDGYLKKDPSHKFRPSNRTKFFRNVCKGAATIFTMPHRTLRMKGLPCRLIPATPGYLTSNLATGVRKEFPFTAQFKYVHMRLLEGGFVHKFRDEKIEPHRQQKFKVDKTHMTNESVCLAHVIFPIILYAASVIFSGLILILEIVASRTVKGFKTGKVK